jgi:hypothetical protein
MFRPNSALLPLALAALLALGLAGCGGDQPEPTATPAPVPTTAATVTAAPAQAPAQSPASPLAQPGSPLAQPVSPLAPESPLPEPAEGFVLPPAAGPDGRPLQDMEAIRQIAALNKTRTPQPGLASMSFLLFSTSVDSVIPGNLAYLTKAVDVDGKLYPPNVFVGPNAAAGDVATYTDEYGRVNVDNLAPGNYVIAVWTVYDYIIIDDPEKPGYPQIFEVKAGDQLDLGLLEIGWP